MRFLVCDKEYLYDIRNYFVIADIANFVTLAELTHRHI